MTPFREKADYEDFLIASKKESEEVLQKAKVFIAEDKKYLTDNDFEKL